MTALDELHALEAHLRAYVERGAPMAVDALEELCSRIASIRATLLVERATRPLACVRTRDTTETHHGQPDHHDPGR